MNDYTKMFKAFVAPYLAVCSFSCIGFLLVTGQTVDQFLYIVFFGALAELGIEFGAFPAIKNKLKKGKP